MLQSVFQWVHILLFLVFVLLVQVVHGIFFHFILLLFSAFESFLDVVAEFVNLIRFFVVCVVLTLFAHFTVEIDHDFFAAEITYDSLNFVSIELSITDYLLSFESLSFCPVNWVHVLQIHSVHVHKSKKNQNSVPCVIIHTKTMNNQHDYNHEEKDEWKH